MLRKNHLFLLIVLTLVMTAPAWADQIDFNAIGSGGTWSFSGSGPLTATADQVSVKLVSSSTNNAITNGVETFTTGAFTGGSGTLNNPWTFGPSAANSITVMGCAPPATGPCTSTDLFSGQFLTAESVQQGNGSLLFDADDVTGTVNSSLLSFLGMSSTSSMFTGTLDFTLSGNIPGGDASSGDLVVGNSVPEPASMVLLGTGLLGLALLFRKKLRQSVQQ